ncbi:hypothetical protein CDFC105_64378 [Clostridioides difficile]|nr:hypothetical protein CDFC105_64378 [Clostridioides difficile]
MPSLVGSEMCIRDRYYLGKIVKLTLTNNKVLVGKVTGFDDKYDNFDGFNSIEIDLSLIHI